MVVDTAAAPQTMSIVVVDDHTTFAELLIGALGREPDLRCLGIAKTVEDGVRLCLELRPDMVVMDYHLPDGNGLECAERILSAYPEACIVMLTGDPTPDALERAAELGICGFLPKDGSLSTMLDTLRRARGGTMVVHPALLAQARSRANRRSASAGVLTRRELDVLRLMAGGGDVRTNAARLGISTHTCRGYIKAIHSKLGVHSQLEAVVTASRMGLLPAAHNA
ncbi:response regulator [Arthrobacter sp. KK5.5]|uniref:response regulator n=1 Tax=Arthrobacter sp. KK5.5 TaxID=3373084 RepID=UPI003EE65827